MGYRIFNKQTQEYQGVTAKDLPSLLQSGNYSLDPSENYKASVPGGGYFDVNPNSDFSTIMEDGLQFEDDAERVNRTRLERAEEYPGLAVATGALRGASGGLSDVGLRVIDETSKAATGESLGVTDFVSDVKQANPMASALGEIGGTIASLASPMSAPSLFAKAGVKTTEKLARQFGVKLAEKPTQDMIARAAARGMGSAVEGALYGASQTISEAALGNPEDAAENLIGNVGWGMLFGGAAGAVPGFLGDVYRGKVAGFASKQVDNAIDTVAEKSVATTKDAVAGIADLADGVTKALKGSDDVIDDLLGDYLEEGVKAQRRTEVIAYMEDPAQAIRKVGDTIQGAFNAAQDLSYAITGDAKIDLINKFGQAQGAIAKKAAFKAIDVMDGLIKDRQAFMKSEASQLVDRGLVNNIGVLEKKYRSKLSEIYKSGDTRVMGESFKVMDDFKREFDKLTKPYLDKSSMLSPREQYTKEFIQKNYRTRVMEALEDEKTFGELGNHNKTVNKAISRFARANEAVQERLGVENPITRRIEVSPQKLKTYLDNPEAVKNDLTKKIFDEFIESSHSLVKLAKEGNMSEFLASLPEETLKILDNAVAIKKSTEDLKVAIIAINAREHRTGAKLSGMLLGQAVGSALGGSIGAIAGSAFGPAGFAVGSAFGSALGAMGGHIVSSPATRFRLLAKMERAILANQSETVQKLRTYFRSGADSVEGGLSTAKSYLKPRVRAGAMSTFSEMIDQYNMDNSDEKRVKRVKQELDEKSRSKKIPDMMTDLQKIDPQKIYEDTQKKLEAMDFAAPEITAQIAAAQVRGIQFLQSKIPQNTLQGLSDGPSFAKMRVSDSEQAKFKRYVESVMEPMDTLNKFVEGRLQSEHVEAMRAVYPQLYRQIQAQVMDSITSTEKEIPYKKKLETSILLEVPTIAAMHPDFLASLQMAYEPVQSKGSSANVKGMQINLNTRQGMTQTQQIMS